MEEWGRGGGSIHGVLRLQCRTTISFATKQITGKLRALDNPGAFW